MNKKNTGIVERLYRQSIKDITERLAEIEELITESPLVKIIEGRQKVAEFLKENGGNHEKILAFIEPLAAEEKRLFKVAKIQHESKLWDEKHELTFDLYELESALTLELMRKRKI